MRKLSSHFTWFWKFVFPVVWIGGFGAGTIMIFVLSLVESDPDLIQMRWHFLIGLFMGTTMIYWALIRLRKVRLENDTFVISNYRKEIRVKVSDVKKVSGSIFFSPELAWLHLGTESELGSKIQFMPPIRNFFNPFSRHPLVNELNSIIGGSSHA